MEWFLKKDELTKKEIIRFKSILKYSKTFDKVILNNERFNKLDFLGYVIKETGDKDIDKMRERLIERVIYVNNYLLSDRLHEIVDYDYINEIGKKAIVVDYYDGIMLISAIRRNHFKFGDDPTNSPVNVKRIMRNIVPPLVYFQKDIFYKGLFHIGLYHKHIVVQIDDNLKVNGLRYIVRHFNGILDDPAITNVQYYGDVLNKRYSPPELHDYVKSRGNKKVSVLGIFSYQLGVLLFDIFTKGENYVNSFGTITPELVSKSRFYIGNHKIEKKVKELVKDLVKPDPNERILDFDMILDRIYELT